MNVEKSVSAKIYFGYLIYHILVYIKLIMFFVLQYGSTITKDVSNDHIACLPESLKKALKDSSHKAIFWNDSGDRIYKKIEDPTKFEWKWNDSSYVRLPFSSLNRSLLENSSSILRWKSINEKLKKLEFAIEIFECYIPNFTGKLLADHLAGWSTSEEYNYEILKTNSDLNEFNDMLIQTLQFIILEATQLPHRLSGPVPILKQKSNDVIYLNRRLASSLLANMFLCTFPEQGFTRELPSVNFGRLFHKDKSPTKTRVKIEKLKCILTYFFSLMNGTNTIPNSIISFERRYNPEKFDWSNCYANLCVYKVLQGRIEDSEGMLQVGFANKVIGGGVLNSGAVQEIMFSVSPELICARVFCEPMNDNEVIVITGTRKFSSHCGYASTFTYEGMQMHKDNIPLDNLGRERNQIVAMDALNFSKIDKESQYTKAKIDRELHKCYLAFQANSNFITPVATGNWGCGVFNGDPELKFIIQWIAASAQKRPLLQFYESAKHQSVKFFEVPNLLLKKGKRVREVYDMLIGYGKQRKDNSMYWDLSLFDYMREKLKPPTICIFQSKVSESEEISAEVLQTTGEYVKNGQCHGVGIEVLQIIPLPSKKSGFKVSKKSGRKMMLFHGTKDANILSILQTGLIVPSNKKQMFGAGIYFADRCSKSSQYCPNTRHPSVPRVGTTAQILLCEVFVGNMYTAKAHNHSSTAPPEGYDSVFCQGRRIPKTVKLINGVEWPVGETTATTSQYLLRYNEYVVYNPDYVDVKYVLSVKFVAKPV